MAPPPTASNNQLMRSMRSGGLGTTVGWDGGWQRMRWRAMAAEETRWTVGGGGATMVLTTMRQITTKNSNQQMSSGRAKDDDGWREAGCSGGGGGVTVVWRRRRNSAMEDGAEVKDRWGSARRGVNFLFFSWQGWILPSILPSTILPKKRGIFFDFGGRFLLQLR